MPSACVFEQKCHMQVQWKSVWVPDKTALRFSLFFLLLFFLLQNLLIWIFVGHMFSWTPAHISQVFFLL